MRVTRSLTVGVLGGMGPEATVDFVSKVIAATPASVDQDHIRLLVDHNPLVPDRQAAFLGDGEDPGVVLAAMAHGLQVAGADFIVMPCNTAHVFAPAIVAAIDVPFVSIIDVTVAACKGFSVVGVMATAACLESGIYGQAFAAAGIDIVQLSAVELDRLTQLIAAIKAGNPPADTGAAMRDLAIKLADRGAEAVVAGCTEIPLVLNESMLDTELVSSTDLLAEATVRRALTDPLH